MQRWESALRMATACMLPGQRQLGTRREQRGSPGSVQAACGENISLFTFLWVACSFLPAKSLLQFMSSGEERNLSS